MKIETMDRILDALCIVLIVSVLVMIVSGIWLLIVS